MTVMPALRRRPAREAEAAMVAINEQAVRAPFMVLFFGTALACAGTITLQFFLSSGGSGVLILGSVCYLAGWALTMAVNVPLNSRLDRSTVDWSGFERPWRGANLTRALLSVAGSILLLQG
ncbi:anthrone oxygenase family protein [Arthrobacter mangrovi]|nr:anthrone oxygenase family protein [Arthrobacter mangrovi]